MKLTFKSEYMEVYESETKIAAIYKVNSIKSFYTVAARTKGEKGEKGKTIATRCSYQKAINIVKTVLEGRS